jgi:hypothetical protein
MIDRFSGGSWKWRPPSLGMTQAAQLEGLSRGGTIRVWGR